MLQPYQVLFDLVVSKGMTVGEAKEHISEELQSEHERTVSPERFVLYVAAMLNTFMYLPHCYQYVVLF